jgi:hypothetical protein
MPALSFVRYCTELLSPSAYSVSRPEPPFSPSEASHSICGNALRTTLHCFQRTPRGMNQGAQVMKQMTSNEKVIAIGSSLLLLLALIFFIAAFLLSR